MQNSPDAHLCGRMPCILLQTPANFSPGSARDPLRPGMNGHRPPPCGNYGVAARVPATKDDATVKGVHILGIKMPGNHSPLAGRGWSEVVQGAQIDPRPTPDCGTQSAARVRAAD